MARGLMVLLGTHLVCSSVDASTPNDLSVSKRLHEEIEHFLRARASGRVNQVDIPELDAFDRESRGTPDSVPLISPEHTKALRALGYVE